MDDEGGSDASWDGLAPRDDAFRITEVLLDPYAARILVAATQEPMTAAKISRECAIPIAAAYRRIRRLESEGLLVGEHGPVGRNGRRTVRYRSRVRSVSLVFEDGRFRARVALDESTDDRRVTSGTG